MEKIYIQNTFDIQNAVEDDKFLKIEGYACHFNQMNLNNQIVDGHSFDTFFDLYNGGKLKPALNYEHTKNVIGGIDSLSLNDTGIYMFAHLNKNVPMNAEMIIPNILMGDIKGFSTEGYIKGGYNGIVELDNGYYVKDFILTAVSVVSTPADWDAEFSLSNVFKGFEAWKLQNNVIQPVKKIYMYL